MGDIDFEEQIELERIEREKNESSKDDHPKEKVDPDGTVFEWDPQKKAWFPKIDTDFIAQYQMNYGVQTDGSSTDSGTDNQQDYYNYYQNYYQAQAHHEQLLMKKTKEIIADTHEDAMKKLEHLENKMQTREQDVGVSSEAAEGEYQADSREVMEKYTDEQKKQYNEYWSYFYGSENHDYYSDCMAQYRQGDDSQTPVDMGGRGNSKTVQKDETEDGKKTGKKRKGQQQERDEGWFSVNNENNTNVYVSGLPFDIKLEEFKELMNKYGLIMYDPRTHQPKVKLYMDDNGVPKGDGRCCFIKKESVDLILNLLDGADYRGHTIKVERAAFQLKGEYDPAKKKKKLTNKEKKKLREKQAKLFDWRPDKPRGVREKHEKVVVLKNVFDPKDFEDDPVQINLLTIDMRTECSNYGEVKKVTVYDRHQDGVVLVHFKEPEQADVCITHLNQRYFAQRRLLASTWDGHSKFEVMETEAEREARIKKWENFLESSEKDDNKTAADSSIVTPGAGLAVKNGNTNIVAAGSAEFVTIDNVKDKSETIIADSDQVMDTIVVESLAEAEQQTVHTEMNECSNVKDLGKVATDTWCPEEMSSPDNSGYITVKNAVTTGGLDGANMAVDLCTESVNQSSNQTADIVADTDIEAVGTGDVNQ